MQDNNGLVSGRSYDDKGNC